MNISKCDELFANGEKIYAEHSYDDGNTLQMAKEYIMLIYIAYGSGFISVNNKTIPVSEKDIFVINRSSTFKLFTDKKHRIETYTICFSPDFAAVAHKELRKNFFEINCLSDDTKPYHIYTKDSENGYIRNIVIRIIDEFMSEDVGHKLALQGYLSVLLTLVLRCCHNLDNNIKYSNNNHVDETIRYIHQNIYSDISPSKIALARKISQEHLSRVFKKHTGVTLTKYINSIRIKKIMDILENTNRPIENISLLFKCRTSYLQKIFKSYTGLTMSQYRNKYHYKHI